MGKRQSFTREFKLEAVRLLRSCGQPAGEVARELGVRRNHLSSAYSLLLWRLIQSAG